MIYKDIGKGRVYNADCFEVMKLMPDGCVDMILADLPYGTTACKWDTVIPFEPMWKEFNRITKPCAPILLFGSEPFSSAMRMSNIKNWKYDWIWEKSKGCNFTHAKNMPIKFHEEICAFSNGKIGHVCQVKERRMPYNPQGLVKVDKQWSRPQKYENGHALSREGHSLSRVIEFENYPKSILKFSNSDNRERGLHPTQKPVALFEYLIKTYTNENELVFDPTAGSLTTGIATENLGRRWVCCEKDTEHGYFEKGVARFQ